MSRKRRNTSSPEAESPRASKRHNREEDAASSEWDSSDEGDSKEKPQFNESTGQSGAFPGLGKDSDELFYGPASDGLEYLRMVRSEARGVPQILTVPSSTQTQDASRKEQNEVSNHGQDGGFFRDGTYTALAPASSGEAGETTTSLSDAQEYYYDSLLKHFRVVQATMRCTPPLHVIESLSASKLISLPEDSRKARTRWESLITTDDPHPAQLAVMDPLSVLQLVKLLRIKLINLLNSEDGSRISRVGGWLWAVLGRCRDRGELSSEEIGELRQLAQRAIYIQQRLSGEQQQQQHASNGDHASLDIDDDGDGSQDGHSKNETTLDVHEEGEVPPSEATSLVKEAGTAIERERLVAVTLDMVITVVGEVYGQRDLLESRRKWEEKPLPI